MWLFYCLSFIGLLIMRYTKRNIKRPFKVWTPVPMVMICSALFLITVPLVFVSVERWYILLGLILVLTGAPVYLLLVHNKYRPAVFTRISSMITDVSNNIFYTSSFNNTEDITIEYSYQ
ncbi:PREDICTED: b(0,+)-type amino acid transporter 1-like [Amphimedon queenslandica]|uniref:Amino acid permease/ SLC12A domain-containing protein n=1 Tax=Amphimedon queenslandica TaxID=400682 RepID=A0A1X7UZN1_AMPQE|nr:PREDICTED: b(0,+)-type amino acid transporter 1-like [Amphimedon queenslandica]|eukprot:XP_003386254.2 PREDICTED: b(0,+)-type amino acid transporter 1-like [Amphimedon queenslandica]